MGRNDGPYSVVIAAGSEVRLIKKGETVVQQPSSAERL
jgi:hypothetical protein